MTQRSPIPAKSADAASATARQGPDAAGKALARLLVGVSEPVFVLDEEGRFASASKSLLTQLGLRDRQLIGRRVCDVLDGESAVLAGGSDGPVRLRTAADGPVVSFLRTLNVDVAKGRRFRVGILGAPGAGGDERALSAAEGVAVVRRDQMRQEFNETLQSRYAGNDGPHEAMAGRIEVICLDDVKASLGREWSRYRDRAMRVARSIIDQRLTPEDVFAETEDDSFVICFATLSHNEARLKADLISREIRDRLLGEDTRPFHVQTQVDKVRFGGGDAVSADLFHKLVSQLDEAREARARFVEAAREEMVKTARLIVTPLTSADPSAVRLSAARIGGEGVAQFRQIVGTDAETKAIFDLDGLVLALAIKHLFNDRSRLATLIVPVHYRTLAERRFLNDYVKLCERMDAGTRRRLYFELHDIPADAPTSRLQDMFGCLSQYSARRVMRFDGPLARLGDISRYRLSMLALPAREEHAQTPASARAFAGFVGLLRGQGCQILIRAVADRRAAQWYFDNRVDYVSLANRRDAAGEADA